MKTCPHCSAHYDPRVDFCFADGSELQVELGAVTFPLYQEDPLDHPLPEVAARVEYAADLLEPPDPGHFALDDIGEESTADVIQPVELAPPPDDGHTAPMPFGYEPTDPGALDDGHTAPFPFSPDPLPEAPGPAPLGDDVTVPIPLDQAQPIEPVVEPAPKPAPKPTPVAKPVLAAPVVPAAPAPAPAPVRPAPVEPDYGDDPEERQEASRTGVFLAVAALIGAVVVAGVIVVATQGPDEPVAATEDVAPVEPDPVVEAPPKPEPVRPPADVPVDPEPAPEDEPAPEEPPADDPVVEAELPEDPVEDPVVEPAFVQVRIQTSPPGALVYVDGKVVGNSPTTQSVGIGPHKVRAELEGHKTMEILASVTADTEVVEVRLPAVERTRSVQLFVPPGHYKVQVAGQSIDTLPATIELPIGTHSFVVHADDGSSFEVRKRVSDAQGQNLLLLPD